MSKEINTGEPKVRDRAPASEDRLATNGANPIDMVRALDLRGSRKLRAGDRDRTGMTSLEGWGSTIELHPHDSVVTEPNLAYRIFCIRLLGVIGA